MIITITGNSGSGKTTVAKLLSQTLGFHFYSVGGFLREIAKERFLSIQGLIHSTTATELQELIMEKLLAFKSKNHIIIDSRIAWIVIPGSIKVYLHAPYSICAKRLIGSENRPEFASMNVTAAIAKLQTENQSEIAYFSNRFAVQFDDPKNFDLYLSSKELTPQQVHDEILLQTTLLNQPTTLWGDNEMNLNSE